jgi:hypothetical protein
MTELLLMYVSEVTEDLLTLSGVGSPIGVQIKNPVPPDVMHTLKGRQVWIESEWGDRCEIHSWPALPKPPEKTND